MPISLQIAAATADDYDWCAQLMSSSEPWITLRRDLDGSRVTLCRPGTDLFVAHAEGERAGFILLAPYGMAASPYIASFGIAAGARGRGIGSALLRFAEERFSGRGHVFLLVSSFNQRAREFYSRHGFQFIGELKDYIVAGHSELILCKRLL